MNTLNKPAVHSVNFHRADAPVLSLGSDEVKDETEVPSLDEISQNRIRRLKLHGRPRCSDFVT